MRYVYVVIPILLYKIDRLAAGVIAMAVLIPFLGMTWRYIKINWLLLHGNRRWYNQNRIRVNQLRPGIMTAQVDLAIKTGLADTD